MHTLRIPAAITVTLLLSIAAFGQSRLERPLREAVSSNERFRFEIRAGRSRRSKCRGALFEKVAQRRNDRRIWQQRLVNEVAPQKALVADDGRFVVTFNEFQRGGGAHAVAIYDARGKLLREYALPELLQGDDWQHVSTRKRAVIWLDGAKLELKTEPPCVLITLKWNRRIRIDLLTLAAAEVNEKGKVLKTLVDKDKAAQKPDAATGIPPEILALLEDSANPTSQPAGTDQAAGADEVLQALREMYELADAANLESITEAIAADEQFLAKINARNQPTPPAPANPYALLAGMPVPRPDPANPVDYVAWLATLTETEGPSAAIHYQALTEAFVPWEGDEELYKAALAGDLTALNSPEIQAWLAANQTALAELQAAPGLEYNGMFDPSEDGSVIGILLPSLSPRRRTCQLALMDAQLKLAAGDTNGALNNYVSNLAAGAQTSNGITLIDNLVGIAMQHNTAESLLDTYAGPHAGEIDYAALATELDEQYQPTRRVSEILNGERTMFYDVVQRMFTWDSNMEMYRVSDDGVEYARRVMGWTNDDDSPLRSDFALMFMLGGVGYEHILSSANECYDRLSAATAQPYQEAKVALDALEHEIQQPAFRLQNPMLSGMLPALSRCNYVGTRGDSMRQATRLITHLKAYRQQYGSYPDSLEVFADRDFTHDPFTGDYFAYRRDGDDFTLYSLGDNGVDDGGVEDSERTPSDLKYWPREEK